MTRDEKFQLVENYIVENQQAYYRLAYSYVKNKENALDIVQEAVLKALRSIDRLAQLHKKLEDNTNIVLLHNIPIEN